VIAGSFEIVVSDYTSSVEEYRRAQQAPRSDLPPLSDDQRAAARGFKISEEEYRRGVLAGIYGRKRQQARGRRLGEEVRKILSDLGSDDRVVRVAYEMDRLRWVVRVESSGGAVDIAIPCELADDYLDYVFPGTADQLKGRVSEALGAVGALAER